MKGQSQKKFKNLKNLKKKKLTRGILRIGRNL